MGAGFEGDGGTIPADAAALVSANGTNEHGRGCCDRRARIDQHGREGVPQMTDLIRKSDAMREMWKHANGKTVLGGQTYQSLTLEVALDAIAALPAVTAGVKPMVWEDFGDWGEKASAYYQANYLI